MSRARAVQSRHAAVLPWRRRVEVRGALVADDENMNITIPSRRYSFKRAQHACLGNDGHMPRKPVAKDAVLDAFEALLIEVGERAATPREGSSITSPTRRPSSALCWNASTDWRRKTPNK